jgi:anti-sigma-K factor RskA
MTARDLGREQSDCGRDAGAYVLGALGPEEAEEFRRHMATCVVCRDEVAALQSVVDELPMAAPQLPAPRALRRRVTADARAERVATARRGSDRRARRPLAPRARARGAFALAAALALLAVVVVGLTHSPGRSSLTRVVRASVAARSASAVVRLTQGHGELIIRRMPAAPAGKVYEVWLRRRGGSPLPTSALFDVTASGAATVDVPGDLRGVQEMLVTPEPLGGSSVPTHAPVILARLA